MKYKIELEILDMNVTEETFLEIAQAINQISNIETVTIEKTR